ncbi:XRE family transcriptional regulator [Streptomyces scopuliridis]|uniref:helix-turn-helix domain-containing protein n=1 Tax=Streptomyces scopuliridis TaxID=452529 RepID=UPI002DD95F57|nr:helix-turn-helix domain-containing protein [Streptomyces scopuliridis]WSB32134.1 XRE family transcriptional regulator [Streptomyces scopuliridis]
MRNQGELKPHEAQDAVEFVALLRRLKEQSGLTYRQLDERAAALGEVLPRSTLAEVLRRQTLPRPEMLAVFVRLCGDGPRVEEWLETRERIAAGGPPHADPVPLPRPAASGTATETAATGTSHYGAPLPGTSEAALPASRRWRLNTPTGWSAAVVVALALASTSWFLMPDGESTPTAGAVAEGWSRIRPVGSPSLCVTEGRQRSGAYKNAIAVQRSCAQAVPPRTFVKAVGDGTYYIQWDHPDEGVGCLTVLESGPAKGLLEPWEDCSSSRLSQHFRMEPVNGPRQGAYRLRPAHSGLCVGINDSEVGASAAEVIQQPCTGKSDQEFYIEAE